MPPGSPGMEQGARRDPCDVLIVHDNGRYSIYSSYRNRHRYHNEGITIMKQKIITALFIALTIPVAAYAVEAHHQPAAAGAADATPMADGEVRKVDMDAKKITLRHGPIPNLDMPAMTMVFQVRDPALLDKVKAGDKIKFSAEKAGGAFIVTHIEPPK